MKRCAFIILMLFVLYSCGVFFESETRRRSFTNFEKPIRSKFEFPQKKGDKFIYQCKVCLKGDIKGELMLNGEAIKLKSKVDTCFKHEQYEPYYNIHLNPVTENVTGKIDVEVTFYY